MGDLAGTRLAMWANGSTIAASFVAIGAFIASFCFFEKTLDAQANANALTMMNEHLKLFVETPALHECDRVLGIAPVADPMPCPAPAELPKRSQCIDAAEHGAFTAETIYDLAPEDGAWEKTVIGMIRDDRWWYESADYRAERYDEAFRKLVLQELPTANDPQLKLALEREKR